MSKRVRLLSPREREYYVAEHLEEVTKCLILARSRGYSHWLLIDWDDVKAAGYLGLCEAAAAFDCSMSVKFSTYCRYFIRGEMQECLNQQRSHGGTVSLNDEITAEKFHRTQSNEWREWFDAAELTSAEFLVLQYNLIEEDRLRTVSELLDIPLGQTMEIKQAGLVKLRAWLLSHINVEEETADAGKEDHR